MIIKEMLDNELVKIYSDKKMYIYGGFPAGEYEEAVELASENREYIETDKPIPQPPSEPPKKKKNEKDISFDKEKDIGNTPTETKPDATSKPEETIV